MDVEGTELLRADGLRHFLCTRNRLYYIIQVPSALEFQSITHKTLILEIYSLSEASSTWHAAPAHYLVLAV